MFKIKLKKRLANYLLTQKESNLVKGGRFARLYKGKSHGYPPPFDEV